MRLSVALMVALTVCGCGQPSEEELKAERDRLWAKIDAKAEKERQEKIANAEPLETYGWPANSPEELAEAYKKAFAAGDIVAIEGMTKFDDVPDEKRESLLNLWLSTRPSGKATIKSSGLRPPKEREQAPSPREVVAVFEGNYRYNDDSGSGSTTGLIVEEEGQFWFYVFYVDPSEQTDEPEDE